MRWLGQGGGDERLYGRKKLWGCLGGSSDLGLVHILPILLAAGASHAPQAEPKKTNINYRPCSHQG